MNNNSQTKKKAMLDVDMLERHLYKDALESASNFNTRLLVERQSRLPFLDTQTNIAQVNCQIWKKQCERIEPQGKGVEYAYQIKYWRKLPKVKKQPSPAPVVNKVESAVTEIVAQVPTPTPCVIKPEEDTGHETPPSEPTPEEMSPASDDYEMYYERKRKRQSRGSTKRSRGGPVDNLRKSRSRKSSVVSTRSTRSRAEEPEPAVPIPTEPNTYNPADQPVDENGKKKPSHFCDFCLGDNIKNKKSGTPEQMISCVDCGRSAHPTCLQFEGSLAENVKSYAWQCLECKSCSICGTSDNDDQLLFCDECDRGFHMYCLTPRIENPPEGRWECHMCNKC